MTRKIRVLELFCGTKSIGKYCNQHAHMYETVSLDIDPKCSPDILCSILDWRYWEQYPVGYFDIIWASVPCQQYSVLRTTGGPRDIEGANAIVQRTQQIFTYFQPKVWFIENPATGMLKDQPFMQGLPFVDADYCCYGYPYRKRTRFWTNAVFRKRLLLCDRNCGAMVRDPVSGLRRHAATFGGNIYGIGLRQRYSIPPLLVEALFEGACETVLLNSPGICSAYYSESRGEEAMSVGGVRTAIRIQSVNVEDVTDIQEYASIASAAKAVENEVPQNNVRALMARHIASGKPLCGRIWKTIDSAAESVVDDMPAPSPPKPQVKVNANVATMKTGITRKEISPNYSTLNIQSNGNKNTESLKNCSYNINPEIELQRQQVILKAKQVELLMRYIEKADIASDPSIHILVKKYLADS